MIWEPRVLLDDGASTPSGGAPAAAASPGDGAPTSPIPDSPPEPAPSHDNFAGMESNDFDLVELPTEDATTGEAGAPPPVEPPVQADEKPATPAPAGPQPTPPQPAAPEQNVPTTPRSALDQAIEGFRTSDKQVSEWASTNLFALSDTERELLETDAVAAIPKLMGRVYSQALQATTNLIKNFVPPLINEGVATTNARTAKAAEALQEFYAANTHLNPQQHGALVDKWARAFRAANPNGTRAEAIKFVGSAVSAEAGIHAGATANGSGKAAQRPAPFAPARPGTRVQQPSAPHDPYEGMDMEFDQER